MADQWVFPDPVFGPTVFEGLEKKLIETAEVNRLIYLKQLSTVYFRYPSADYTRFEHSIGMASLVKRFVLEVLMPREKLYNVDIPTSLVSAAIVHDIGHPEWSHAGEFFARYMEWDIEHDDLSARLVLGEDKVKEHFKDYGLPLVSDVLKSTQKTIVSKLIRGEAPLIEGHWTEEQRGNIELRNRYLGQIISSPYVDLDRVAYLIRDAFYVAGAASFFSLKDVLENLMVRITPPENAKELVFGNIPFAESFILTRDLMRTLIYNNPDNILAEEMLARAFRICYEGADDPYEVWFKTDHEMWEDMRRHPLSRHIAILVRNRITYEILWQVTFSELESGTIEVLEALEADKPEILKKEHDLTPRGVSPEQVILCICIPRAETPDITESPVLVGNNLIKPASEVSALVKSMNSLEHRNLRSFALLAVDPDITPKNKQEILENFKGWLEL
ncbi:MAG: HD domain-containing protein [Dehalococcoidia bacterium]|nr:HD domain-containing protein [Dehalococcoidia bacterium]